VVRTRRGVVQAFNVGKPTLGMESPGNQGDSIPDSWKSLVWHPIVPIPRDWSVRATDARPGV